MESIIFFLSGEPLAPEKIKVTVIELFPLS